MTNLYLIALIIIGVILTNIIKIYIHKIPESFLLILIGAGFSFLPAFRHFTLDPEFFMLIIIAPIMFMDGQKQSFHKLKTNIRVIIELSVSLAIFTALIVGVMTNYFEKNWTLALSIALAAIVVPTDAVAVKSITNGLAMPKGVNNALELESLFNDATGLVLLDLALSVISIGNFSLVSGIEQFLFVALGGILVGFIASVIIVRIRYSLNLRSVNAAATTIPINLLTPFFIYLLAEHLGVSGILAVVTSGVAHNWENNRLKLNSTEIQLTTHTIWETITTILNEVVFLILGLSLPAVINQMVKIGSINTFKLVILSIGIYVVMFTGRFWWIKLEKNQHIENLFGKNNQQERSFNARIFGISGVHGTITLAMAFSLPQTINNQPFPYRNELIIIATLVILISLLVAAVVLPMILPNAEKGFSAQEINDTRDQMIDYAILKSQQNITDRNLREAVISDLNSQKTNTFNNNQITYSDTYLTELGEITDFVSSYTHSDEINDEFDEKIVDLYNKILQRTLLNSNKRQHPFKSFRRQIRRTTHEIEFHVSTRTFTKKQKKKFRKQRMAQDPQYAAKVNSWNTNRLIILDLNEKVMREVDNYLETKMQTNLKNNVNSNELYQVRKTFDRFFSMMQRQYHQKHVEIDNSTFVKLFQDEFDFVQNGVQNQSIAPEIANILFNEINQAQSLQLMQNQQEV
ncbi:sodium:proton antiporter [Fructilactobacillus vespulae]|uniref:cation:proton antiporter n=1 Tax=Fructilactobacillus vespulae TaxID=1249630 RepID=UPI0039B3F22C